MVVGKAAWGCRGPAQWWSCCLTPEAWSLGSEPCLHTGKMLSAPSPSLLLPWTRQKKKGREVRTGDWEPMRPWVLKSWWAANPALSSSSSSWLSDYPRPRGFKANSVPDRKRSQENRWSFYRMISELPSGTTEPVLGAGKEKGTAEWQPGGGSIT